MKVTAFLALLRVGGAVLLGSSATARTNLRSGSAKSQEQLSACDCTQCLGERRNEGGDGTVGFQCFPGRSGLDDCRQTENPKEWAVQSAEVLSYDRFCMYTCKPVLGNRIEPSVNCERLSPEEIQLSAQSPSFNGKEIVYQAHPMASVGPISRLVAMPEASMIGVAAAAAKSGDPVSTIKNAFATIRKEEAEEQMPSPFDLPATATAPPLCVCHCGGKGEVDRFRKTPGGPHAIQYPKPAKMSLPSSVTSAGVAMGKDAEPPQPPMPPPPPPALPPPMMPMGVGPMLTELPTVPEAPPEVTGPLDLPMPSPPAASPGPAPAAASAASPAAAGGALPSVESMGLPALPGLSLLQQGQEAANPIACNCIC
eukprot:gb/GFBE01043887.1/.p1 GENE.gb/GFBE01043887.1/~~gb/GFBE01043887.1/.p1  ORF type:complete len:368 (+),score=57.30 gb/GFBE01043887.1/:1-1104(+)